MFMMVCEQKGKYAAVPLLALVSLPVAYVSVMLTGGGHAAVGGYVPFLLLYGPLAVVMHFFDPTPMAGVMREVFIFGSPYVLYLFYGFLFVFLSSRNAKLARLLVITLLVLHSISGIVFLYLTGIF